MDNRLEDNPVPSLDLNFTTDNSPLFIKAPEDWRKTKKWELVTNLEWMPTGKYWICKTNRFGWIKLQGCEIKQNGVETDKEKPKVDKLIDYRSRRTEYNKYKCIKPTSTLTKNKIYKGFTSYQYNSSSHSYIDTIHVINDNGRHLSYSEDRFMKL